MGGSCCGLSVMVDRWPDRRPIKLESPNYSACIAVLTLVGCGHVPVFNRIQCVLIAGIKSLLS